MLNLRAARPGKPHIIAHRGASDAAPENTMAAFDLAVRQGAELVEFDVQVTSDGAVVVMHDFAVDRTTDGRGLVKDMSLEEVRKLDAAAKHPGGYARQVVPTFDEVLDWSRGRVPLAIEIKSGPVHHPGVENRLVAAIARHDLRDSVVVISFDHGVLLRLKKAAPDIATGVLYACAPVAPANLAMAAHSDALLPHWSDLTPEMVEEAHANGLAISTWAVDQERDLAWVVSMGVDAVATNYPDRLARLLEKE